MLYDPSYNPEHANTPEQILWSRSTHLSEAVRLIHAAIPEKSAPGFNKAAGAVLDMFQQPGVDLGLTLDAGQAAESRTLGAV